MRFYKGCSYWLLQQSSLHFHVRQQSKKLGQDETKDPLHLSPRSAPRRDGSIIAAVKLIRPPLSYQITIAM